MQASDPTFYGTVTLNGSIVCSPTTGRKIDIYSDGATIYGFGLNDFEFGIFGGEGSSLCYRVAVPGAVDLAAPVVFRANTAGISLPTGATLAIGANNLTLDAAGALLVNGAPLSGGGGASGTASITGGTINGATVGATTAAAGRFTTLFTTGADIEGGTIDATAIGNTTPAAIRGTTLALTGSLTARFVFAAPNTAAGAPTWRQLLASDISGLGTLATANAATPPVIGNTTPAAITATTLTHTGFLLRSMTTGLTASTTNTQAGALALTASVNNITTAAANTAVRLPNAAPATGTAAEIIVRNGGANAVNVFPATSSSINALAANAAFSLAAGASARFLQLSATLYITA